MALPRMRSAPEAIREIRREDPGTAFTLRALRRMMETGEIPVVKVCSKRLINLDLLLEYLNHGTFQPEQTVTGQIRRIDPKEGLR